MKWSSYISWCRMCLVHILVRQDEDPTKRVKVVKIYYQGCESILYDYLFIFLFSFIDSFFNYKLDLVFAFPRPNYFCCVKMMLMRWNVVKKHKNHVMTNQKIMKIPRCPLTILKWRINQFKRSFYPLKKQFIVSFFKRKIVNSLLQSTSNKVICTMFFPCILAFFLMHHYVIRCFHMERKKIIMYL